MGSHGEQHRERNWRHRVLMDTKLLRLSFANKWCIDYGHLARLIVLKGMRYECYNGSE